ncbi:MAG: spore maturation protein, partial [Planctomycetota bacterium]
NENKETATNSMATFLAINTSSVTLVPFSVIGLRVAAGSEDPAAPVFGMICATFFSTIVAVFTVRTLSKLPMFAPPPRSGGGGPPADESLAEGGVA